MSRSASRIAARAVELAGGETIGRLVECELTELDRMLVERDDYEPIRDVVATLVGRMRGTLRYLIDIGVGYLSLNRGVPTLSGGESQRVKMARQLDCDLVDLIYILDEPTGGAASAGHRSPHRHAPPPARPRQLGARRIEHDPAVIRAADWVVDIGPRAGDAGSELVFGDRLDDLLRSDTATSEPSTTGSSRRAAGAGPSTTRSASRTQRPTTCATSLSGYRRAC